MPEMSYEICKCGKLKVGLCVGEPIYTVLSNLYGCMILNRIEKTESKMRLICALFIISAGAKSIATDLTTKEK